MEEKLKLLLITPRQNDELECQLGPSQSKDWVLSAYLCYCIPSLHLFPLLLPFSFHTRMDTIQENHLLIVNIKVIVIPKIFITFLVWIKHCARHSWYLSKYVLGDIVLRMLFSGQFSLDTCLRGGDGWYGDCEFRWLRICIYVNIQY